MIPHRDHHEMAMGREVAAHSQRLRSLGWCWLCAMAEAINLVQRQRGGDVFDWRNKERAAGHECRCDLSIPIKSAPPPPARDVRLPREIGEDDGDEGAPF